MLLRVRRTTHAERSGRFRLSSMRVMGTSMGAWMPLPSLWCLISITGGRCVDDGPRDSFW